MNLNIENYHQKGRWKKEDRQKYILALLSDPNNIKQWRFNHEIKQFSGLFMQHYLKIVFKNGLTGKFISELLGVGHDTLHRMKKLNSDPNKRHLKENELNILYTIAFDEEINYVNQEIEDDINLYYDQKDSYLKEFTEMEELEDEDMKLSKKFHSLKQRLKIEPMENEDRIKLEYRIQELRRRRDEIESVLEKFQARHQFYLENLVRSDT